MASGDEMVIFQDDPTNVGTFIPFGVFRANTFSQGSDLTDKSNKRSGGFQELADYGHKKLEFGGSGLLENDDDMKLIIQRKDNRQPWKYQFITAAGTYEGTFFIENVNGSGDSGGEQNFDATFKSSGAYAFTPAT